MLYRRPRSSIEDFIQDYRKTYIYGDFNLDLLRYETCNFNNFSVDLCFEYAYIPLMNKPSRISSISSTVNDAIWHNRLDSALECRVLMSDTSENFSPCVIIINCDEDAENNESFFADRNWTNMASDETYNQVPEKLCFFS